MKKCLPSIVSATLCLSLVMTPFVPVAAAYADVDLPPRAVRSTSETTTTKITIYPLLSAGAARIHIPRRGAILTDLQITAPSLTRSS